MNKKTVPFNEEQIRSIIAKYPTPFHIYDEKAIVDNVRKLIKAFDWAHDFKEYFAVKATPNPYLMRLPSCRKKASVLTAAPWQNWNYVTKLALPAMISSFLPMIRLMKNLKEPWNSAL